MNIFVNKITISAKHEKLADFAALCSWLFASIFIAVFSYIGHGQDFRGYCAAAHVLLDGGNPYDYNQVSSVLVNITGWAGNNPFYYPLWFGWFFTPLTHVPYQTARLIWIFFNLALWIIGLIRLRQLRDWPQKGWRTWLMNLLATFIFAWTTLKFEQAGILLFALLVEILIAYSDQKWDRMGIFLALALIKPNITFLPIAILVVWLLRNKNFRPMIAMAVVLSGLILITTVLTPDWYKPIIQQGFGRGLTNVLDGPNQITGIRLTTTLMDWLKASYISSELRLFIYSFTVLLSAAGILTKVWRSKSIWDVMATALLVNFIITPYAMQYDFPPLTIVLFWLMAPFNNAVFKRVPVLVVAFIASVLFWERPISDGYWIVVGLSVLLLWSLYSTRRYPFRERLRPSTIQV